MSKEAACDSAHSPCCRTRAVTGGDAPGVLAIAAKAFGVSHRVALVDIGGATAVLEVVARLPPHEGILDAAEVNPQVGELMHEERAAVEHVVAVDPLPAIG